MQKQSATQQSAIQDDRSVKSQSKPQAGSQTFDPVCGMDVNPNSSKTEQAQRNGRTYYFCSSECREQFEASPEDFSDEA
jgi:YHS domain-containing protein